MKLIGYTICESEEEFIAWQYANRNCSILNIAPIPSEMEVPNEDNTDDESSNLGVFISVFITYSFDDEEGSDTKEETKLAGPLS